MTDLEVKAKSPQEVMKVLLKDEAVNEIVTYINGKLVTIGKSKVVPAGSDITLSVELKASIKNMLKATQVFEAVKKKYIDAGWTNLEISGHYNSGKYIKIYFKNSGFEKKNYSDLQASRERLLIGGGEE